MGGRCATGPSPWATDCRSGAYAVRLRALAAEWRPDVVEFHLQVMAQYGSLLAASAATKILVDYDPPSAWAAELLREASGVTRFARRVELALWRRYERATRRNVQAVVVFAERDVTAVERTAAGVPVVRIPLAFEVPPQALDPIGIDRRPPSSSSAGSGTRRTSMQRTGSLDRSFPSVREQVPAARLELVGDKPGEEVRRLADGAVAVHGSVPDVTPYLNRAAVVVAPLRLGGSMRGKVLEALGAGKALVATPRAAEGVEALPGRHFVLATTEAELVDAVAGLLLDPDRRRSSRRQRPAVGGGEPELGTLRPRVRAALRVAVHRDGDAAAAAPKTQTNSECANRFLAPPAAAADRAGCGSDVLRRSWPPIRSRT